MIRFYSAPSGNTNPEVYRNKVCIDNGIYNMVNCVHGQLPITNFAVDNGEWIFHTKNMKSDFTIFTRYLDRIYSKNLIPEFIILPDAYDDGDKTLLLHEEYIYLSDRFKCYVPLQKGINLSDIKQEVIEQATGLFIGGCDEWKEKNIHSIINFCRDYGLKCHVGRVGRFKKMIFYNNAGVDSIDSSTFMRNNKIDKLIMYLNALKEQQLL